MIRGDVSPSRTVGPSSGGAFVTTSPSQMTHFSISRLVPGRAWRASFVSGNVVTRVTLQLSQGGSGPSAGAAGSPSGPSVGAAGSPPRGGSLHVLRARGSGSSMCKELSRREVTRATRPLLEGTLELFVQQCPTPLREPQVKSHGPFSPQS